MNRRWGKSGSYKEGFTIVELIIVVGVIGILATIVTLSYGSIVNNAYDANIKTDLNVLADRVKLKALDDGIIPDGGATDLNTGNSTLLNGVDFVANADSYDDEVANLYYCAGDIAGTREFAIVAQSVSGNTFQYTSTVGVTDFSGPELTSVNDGVAVCEAAGFSAPFTWSYGYNPNPSFLWFDWAE